MSAAARRALPLLRAVASGTSSGAGAVCSTSGACSGFLQAPASSAASAGGLPPASGCDAVCPQPAAPRASSTWASPSISASSGGYERQTMHATTILCVRKGGKVVLIGDGQVSMGSTIVKPNARKVRKIGDGVVAGFAGSAADGLTLIDRLENKLEEHPGQLTRAAVELAKQWRQDKALRFLQAELLVADATTTLTVAGNGDVLEPHDGLMAIGSGGGFAVAAARALVDVEGLDALQIAQKAMKIAADMCVYTNSNTLHEVIDGAAAAAGGSTPGAEAK